MRVRFPVLTYEVIKQISEKIDVSSETPIMVERAKFRRRRVNQLRLRGYTNQEIAQKIGCSVSTVEKDLHIIRENSRSWFEEESITDYCQSLNDAIVFCDNAIEDLQVMYSNETDSKTKSQLLISMADLEVRKSILYEKTNAVQSYLNKKNPAVSESSFKVMEVR